MAQLTDVHCDRCRRVETFEQPECAEGHGADCPEWVCTTCGEALFSEVLLSGAFFAGSLTSTRLNSTGSGAGGHVPRPLRRTA